MNPLADPASVLGSLPGVASWRADDESTYTLEVADAAMVAPELVRALVAGGADVLSVGKLHHSLEDVYLQLVDAHADKSDHGARGRRSAGVA